MVVTMTMEEYLELKNKSENYDALVVAAKTVVSKQLPRIGSESDNFVKWLSREEIYNIVYQFGCENNS